MKLLMKRNQKMTSSSRVNFILWAKIETDEQEAALIQNYQMKSAMLVPIFQPNLLRNSLFVTLIAGLLSYIPISVFFASAHIPGPMPRAIAAFIAGYVIGQIYYTSKRETIYVRDLLLGRKFTCKSVIELARKEAFIESVTTYFRQVVESAKHWDGQEAIDIHPMHPAEAKRFILSGPLL